MSTRINITLDESTNKRVAVYREGENIILENGKHNEKIILDEQAVQTLQFGIEVLMEEIETARVRQSASEAEKYVKKYEAKCS